MRAFPVKDGEHITQTLYRLTEAEAHSEVEDDSGREGEENGDGHGLWVLDWPKLHLDQGYLLKYG